jgi:hypothetical protein
VSLQAIPNRSHSPRRGRQAGSKDGHAKTNLFCPTEERASCRGLMFALGGHSRQLHRAQYWSDLLPIAALPARAANQREGPLPDSCTAAKRCHSITSSARAITEAGTVMPSDLAVLRLMLRWKRVGCSNGRSAGLAPFKMRSIREVARS